MFTYVLGEHAHTSAHKCQRNVLGALSANLYLILLVSWDGVFHWPLSLSLGSKYRSSCLHSEFSCSLSRCYSPHGWFSTIPWHWFIFWYEMSLDTKDLHIKIHSAKAWKIPDLTGQWTLNTWWVCRLEDWGCKVTGMTAQYRLVSYLTLGSYRRWISGWVGRGALGSFLGSFQVLWWNIDQSKLGEGKVHFFLQVRVHPWRKTKGTEGGPACYLMWLCL